MASENNEIGDIVKKCKILLLDIEGTTTSISFVKDQLFPYAEANVKEFLESQWDIADVKEAVAALRKLAIEDVEQKTEGVVAIPGEDAGKEEQIEGLVKSVKWQMSADRKVGPLKHLQGLIWKQGYDKGDIKGHVYDDVAPALAQWNSTEGQKVYIYSSGSVQAQKLLFSCSVAGDLLPQIEGHFDTAIGTKQEASSYSAIVEKIGCKPEEILFLTDIVKEAEAARASGLQAALVSREGNAPLPTEATSSYPVLQSFEQLTITNKRKPEPQDDVVPAKVPKTDVESNVKTAELAVFESAPDAVLETVAPSNTDADSKNVTAEIANEAEPEKMEVEDDVPVAETTIVAEPKVAKEAEETAAQIEPVVEEVATSIEAGDVSVCNVKPIIEESVEKTDTVETEKMETESTENVETVETVVEPMQEQAQENYKEESAPVAEETPPAIIIQDVTDDQEIANEGTEMVDDLEPVVEEPPTVEMEDLNNVADVLDKECDEILLKVHDVTNLDSIPVKTMLNSIAEEDIETENGENTNDIVDSILDSEMELGVKPCDNIDIKIEQKIADTKANSAEVIPDKDENKDTNVNKMEEVTAETPVDENIDNKTTVEDKQEKLEDVSSPEITTEVVKDDINAVTTGVSNGDMPVCTVDNMPEPEPIKVENNESNEVTVKADKNTSVSKSSPVEPEDNKMESEESIPTAVESQSESNESEMELADSTAEHVKTNESEQSDAVLVGIESNKKEAVQEPIKNTMESENTPEIKNKEAELKESEGVQLDNENTSEKSIVETGDNNMESKDSVPQESQAKEPEPETVAAESKVNEDSNEMSTLTPVPITESNEIVSNDIVMEAEATEKVNGNMNGETEVNQNGDASKEEELSARLSVENGNNDTEINGANGNGDSSEIEKEQDDKKEADIVDIKVKTVSTDEPRTDPIEQPVEA